MKKTLVSIAAASLLALNFTGCGSSSSSTTDETKEVKVAGIASIVDAAVESGALTAPQLGSGFYTFSTKPSEKMVSTGGFVDYSNDGIQDADEPRALTLSADADKSTLSAFTTLVTESSKSEQEIADLLGLTIDELNSDTSLASLEVQKKVVLANAIVKQAQSGSSTATTITTETTTPVTSGTTTDTTVEADETTSDAGNTSTTTSTGSILPSIDGSTTATSTAASTTPVATTTATPTATVAPEATATPETTIVDTGIILPTISRSLRADAEDSTTPPVLPTVGTTAVSSDTTSTSTDSGVLPSTEVSTNKYDELLAKISLRVTEGESIYSAVANATGISELANLDSATDETSVQAINTVLLTATATDGTIVLPDTGSTDTVVDTPVQTPVPSNVPTPTPVPTVTPTPTPVPTVTPTPTPVPTPTPDNGVIDPESTLSEAAAGDVSDIQNIGTPDEQIGVTF